MNVESNQADLETTPSLNNESNSNNKNDNIINKDNNNNIDNISTITRTTSPITNAATAISSSSANVSSSSFTSSSSKIINNNNNISVNKDNLKLWVGNLPINTTEKEIREFFSNFKIDLIKMTEITESQLACAIVQFFDHESASLARENGLSSMFKGNKLIIDWSNSPPTLSPTLSNSTTTTTNTTTSTSTLSSSSSSSSINSSYYNESYKESHPHSQNKYFHPYPSYQHHQHRTVYYNNSTTTSTSNVNISSQNSTTSSSLTNETKERITDSDPRVNRKLFLGLTYEGETIEDLRNRFGKYGKVEEVVISASGLAFLRFYSTESAILAKRDLGFRYKIQFDKKEPRDLQYYDPNGPSSYYGDRPPPSLDQIEYGRLDNIKPTILSSSSSSLQLTPPLHPPPSDYYNSKDQYNRESYRESYKNKPPLQHPPPPPQQQQPIAPQLSAAFSEPLSNDEYNQFYSFLENLKATNISIKESKDWFILHLKSGKTIVQLINRYITNKSNPVYNKLEVIYLINDILYFGLVRRLNPETKDPISDIFEAYLPSILSAFHKESQSTQNNCLKVLDFWEEKHYYSAKIIQAYRNYIFK